MLTLWSFARKHLRKGMKKMKSIPLEKITVLGGLAHRLLLNSVRLESDIYMPDAVCRLDSGGWPADAEGRTLLALVRQMEATGREPSYLREILRKVYGNFNEKGFLQLGFAGHQPDLSNYYTNNGSLYMTSLVFMPLGLPADHPFWTSPAEEWTSLRAWGGKVFPKDYHESIMK